MGKIISVPTIHRGLRDIIYMAIGTIAFSSAFLIAILLGATDDIGVYIGSGLSAVVLLVWRGIFSSTAEQKLKIETAAKPLDPDPKSIVFLGGFNWDDYIEAPVLASMIPIFPVFVILAVLAVVIGLLAIFSQYNSSVHTVFLLVTSILGLVALIVALRFLR